MDNILLEDDMKEFLKMSVGLLAIGCIAMAAFFVNVGVYGVEQDELARIIIVGVLIGAILLYGIYLTLYTAKYKVTVTENSISVKSVFGSKTIALKQGIVYECKKAQSNYSVFKIIAANEKITVRTKKSEELKEILQRFVECV